MTAVLDSAKTQAFAGQMLGILNNASLALMISVGHRTGLFDVMSELPASTSLEIAKASQLNERYVREWLGAMVAGKIVEHEPSHGQYYLPREYAAWLTRGAAPNNLAVAAQFIAVLGHVEDQVVEAFQHGQGVPYSAYHRFHEVMAEESEQTVVAGLIEHVLPLTQGWEDRLAQGIDVLDVGCGAGLAMIRLAERFPHSRFTGYDFSQETIDRANETAGKRLLSNVQFEVRDVSVLGDVNRFDLITAFDAIHDQAKPAAVLANISQALRENGLFLMQEISGHGHHHADREHPLGAMLYTVSCMHCMSVSLAMGGPGLGAMWGKPKALEMLAEAGFTKVRVETLPHDLQNFWFLAER